MFQLIVNWAYDKQTYGTNILPQSIYKEKFNLLGNFYPNKPKTTQKNS